MLLCFWKLILLRERLFCRALLCEDGEAGGNNGPGIDDARHAEDGVHKQSGNRWLAPRRKAHR